MAIIRKYVSIKFMKSLVLLSGGSYSEALSLWTFFVISLDRL